MMSEQLDILMQIGALIGKLLAPLVALIVASLLLIVWIAWWLWAVNWKKVWPVLAEGAWAPAVLLMIGGAIAWSQLAPSTCDCLGIVTIPNFWWQLGDIATLAILALFCGWVQGLLHWQPAEISLEPPAAAGHDHGHGGHHGAAH
jgi:hypothetical protein